MMFKLIFAAALASAGAASAQSASLDPDAPAPAVADQQPATPATVQDGLQPLDLTEMAEISGGDAVQVEVLTQQQLQGSATGNSVTAQTFTTGGVTFGTDALNGFNGVGNFVINTGANNTLQGAINISVVTAPLP
jgi:hypothetical protein